MSIPFTCFNGYVKRLCYNKSPQNMIFDLIFSQFSNARPLTKQSKKMEDLFNTFVFPVDSINPRRFADHNLPKGIYYTVCIDKDGNDNNTLVNELRAYRDPVNAGMIEVIDLNIQNEIVLDNNVAVIERSPDLGILIHDIDRLHKNIDNIQCTLIGQCDGHDVHMIKLPYQVFKISLKDVIDLRQPKTREWFFEYFSKPQSNSCIIWPEQITDTQFLNKLEKFAKPTIAISRFKLASGRTLKPNNFGQMLPTLMNPDIGGGPGGSTGSTILTLAYWMMINSVSAFIYPSARCDVFVDVQNGKIKDFGGWSLVNYQVSKLSYGLNVTKVIDYSPWCWIDFPKNVTIETEESDLVSSGSFSINGMVDYWADDYLENIKCLEDVQSEINILYLNQPIKEVWIMGVYIIRWMRSLIIHTDIDDSMRIIRKFKGFALRNYLFNIVGGIDDIFDELNFNENINTAFIDVFDICDKMEEYYKYHNLSVYANIFFVSSSNELLVFFIEILKKIKIFPNSKIIEKGFKKNYFNNLKKIPFSDNLLEKITEFIEYGLNILFFQNGNIDIVLNMYKEMEREILTYFRTNKIKISQHSKNNYF